MDFCFKIMHFCILKCRPILWYNNIVEVQKDARRFFPAGIFLAIFWRYIVSGTVILKRVSTLKITFFTARQSARRACCITGSSQRQRQVL